ncbi:MAG TPA: MFS transporter [Ilumatobacteraceae bacterium]|nr:MFS transporter [Ilumatobacteraceae bacterium]
MEAIGDQRADQQVPVWIYLVGFVVLGCALSMSGPALSHLRDRVGTDDGGISLVFVGSSMGYMVGSFVGGRFLDRGHGHQMWAGCMATSVVMIVVISQLQQLGTMFIAFVLLGTVCGVGDVSGNTLVLWSRPDAPGAALNALHLFFALGALSAPILTNRAIAWTGSLWPVAVPLGALTLLCVTVLLTSPAPVKTRTVHHSHEGEGGASVRRGQLLVVGLFFFVYVALEVGFANWIHTYVEQIGYGNANTATGVTATFWVGFSVGRMIAIFLASRFSAGWMLVGSMTLALTSSFALVAVNGGGIGLWVVTFFFGMSIAPQFASMIAYAEAHFALSGASTSVFVGAAGLGGLVMPWLLGQLFDAHGARVLPPVVLAACVITIGAGLWVRHIVRVSDRQRPPVTSMNAPVT